MMLRGGTPGDHDIQPPCKRVSHAKKLALANHTAHGSLPRFGQFALTCSRWGWSAGAGFGRFASLGDVRGIASALLVATFALCPVLEARLVVVVEILTVRTLLSP